MRLDDWVLEAKSALKARGLDGQDACGFLISHLDEPAKVEVQFGAQEFRQDPKQLFQHLRDNFAGKKSATKLLDELYHRSQGPRETLREFSLALMSLAERLGKTQFALRSVMPHCGVGLRKGTLEGSSKGAEKPHR